MKRPRIRSDNEPMPSKRTSTGKAARRAVLTAVTYDLFAHPVLTVPAPATLYSKISTAGQERTAVIERVPVPLSGDLPTPAILYRWYDELNWSYFGGKLPSVRIEYSSRMTSAGSYTPGEKLIRISRRYHELFPDDLLDTLKHEMIHVLHPSHNAAFKREAARIGASLRAKTHTLLRRPPKYIYRCPGCGHSYPRQKRFRMASCGDCSKGSFDPRFKLVLVWSVVTNRREV